MRSTIRHLSALSMLLVAGVVTYSTAAAQETRLLASPTIGPAELEALAYQPIENGNWLPSAKDLEQAAALRPAYDPQAVVDLMSAATLTNSMHRPFDALDLLGQAGERAETMGANELAFRAFSGGLALAEQLQDLNRTQFFLARLEDVATRPGVTAAERKAVLKGEKDAETAY